MARLLHTISQRLIKPSLIATALTCLTHYPAVLAAVPGAMEGAFGVNASGAATYRIPIEVPPGVNGLQPDLSLAYNSQHGNDHLGIGWALEGLSSITRCPTTLAQDGFIDGVDFDTNDRFCLDGQRLVPIAAGATEYRTEIERFAKITAHGTAGSGPAWFRVETKAGQIMDYGFTADARIEASGRSDVLVWALNTVSDRNGNQMTVSYIEDNGNGEFYPSRIDYAGGQSSVRFEYESRPDVRTKHIAGSVRRVTQRLTHAKTYSGETVVGSYHLAYETQGTTNQSRLTGVRKCDKLGNCLASQLFTWSNENSIGFNQQTFWTTAYGNAGGWNSGASYYSTITYPDINGDGVPDICGRSSAGIYCGLNNGSGFNQPTFWTTSYSNAGGWSSDVSYYSTIRYPDINGDGLADICGRSSAGIYCGLNNGNSFNQPTFWTTSYSNAGGWSSGVSYYSTIRYPDINGDGLADICGRSSVGIYCGLSNGNSFNQPTFWTTAYSNAGGWSSSDSYYGTLRYLDINGDGLADICGRSSAGIYCGLSNGNSFNQPTFWTTAYSNAGGWSSSDSYYGTITYPDINGDRLPDICGRSSAGIYCGLNNGSGFNQPTFWTTAYNNSAGWNSSDSYYGTITYPDINGDGLADICGRSSAGISCELNSVEKANLLSDVSKSLGAGTQIAYSPLTDSSIYTKGSGAVYPEQGVQYARYVVGQVESDNGLGGKRTRTYKYSGLKEDLRRRKRLGFASMSVTDQASGITTTTQYSQSFPTIGFEVSKVDTYDNGTPSTTDDIILSAQSHIPASLQTHPGVHFAYASRSEANTYELHHGQGAAPITTTVTDRVYNTLGDPTRLTTSVSGLGLNGSTETHTTVTNNSYAHLLSFWPHNRWTRTEVTNYLPTYAATRDGSCVTADCAKRTTEFGYRPTTGQVIWATREPDTPSLHLREEYNYDGVGNRITTTVRGGDGATAIAARTTSTSYDSAGRFPISTTNALGHTATYSWDARFGVPQSRTDANGLTTQWSYDGFGRKTSEVRPEGTTTTTYHWCNGVNGETGLTTCPSGGAVAATVQVAGAPAHTAYVDTLGRLIRDETQGFNGTATYVDTAYNARGLIHSVSRPYYSGSTAYRTTYSYDAAERLYRTQHPDGTLTNTGYNGLSTTVTNANNQATTRTFNAKGELRKVLDPQSNHNRYRYDPFSNLLEAEDSAGNIIYSQFNIHDHKTRIDDPDSGVWTYQHNVLGELIAQTDAKGHTVSQSYDTLGRLTQRSEAEGTTTWVYDTATKGKGRLASSNGAEGIGKTYTYDTLGRPASTVTTIDGSTYTHSRSYDSHGRLATQTYPASPGHSSGLQIAYAYNTHGYLNQITNAATQASYWQAGAQDADGQLTLATFGNGVVTDSGYNPQTGRLQTLNTHQGGNTLQDLNYVYDALGNLTQRNDYRQGVNENFQYDSLNRLTQSTVSGNASAAATYSYDAIGNLTGKTHIGTYSYGAGNAGPHAVTSINHNGVTRSFTYDANGNQLTNYNFAAGATRAIGWTSYNKPKAISQQGNTDTFFAYGADRARFKQTAIAHGASTTRIYIDSLYEKETHGSKTTHHHYIRAGNTTVAIYKAIDDNGAQSNSTTYLHRDHLGSISDLTDASGNLIASHSYDAFGQRRNANWSDATGQLSAQHTQRGYTGHEHLDNVGLIHMNGRVYDPGLGRFLSADPIIAYVTSTQGFNRYSYTDNNPLARVDPTGFAYQGPGPHSSNLNNPGYNPGALAEEGDGLSVRDIVRTGSLARSLAAGGPIGIIGIIAGPIAMDAIVDSLPPSDEQNETQDNLGDIPVGGLASLPDHYSPASPHLDNLLVDQTQSSTPDSTPDIAYPTSPPPGGHHGPVTSPPSDPTPGDDHPSTESPNNGGDNDSDGGCCGPATGPHG